MSDSKNRSVECIIYGVLFVVLVAAAFVIYPMIFQSSTEVRIGTAKFNAHLAINEVDRLNGLNGVSDLKYNEALLKIYPTVDKWPVIMKDTKIPLDIVWLNSSKQVVYMERDAEISDGDTYQIFRPTKEAKYVLELPSGTIKARMIVLNTVAIFAVDESEVK